MRISHPSLDTTQAPSSAPASEAALRARRERASLKKSCQEFEAIFLQSMFKAMRKTVPEGGLFEKSNATEIYEDMRDQEIAKTIAEKQGLGLGEQMYRQLERRLPPAE